MLKLFVVIFCFSLAACASFKSHKEGQAQEIAPMKTPRGYIMPSNSHYPVPAAVSVNQNATPVSLLPPGIN